MVLTLALLLALCGSVTPELQVAESVSVPGAVGVTTIIAVTCWLLARLPRFRKVTTKWPATVLVDQLLGDAETKFTVGGKVSITVTPGAVPTPRLVTVIV